MKRKVTKAEYEALSPEMKLMYLAAGDGFKLILTGEDDDAGPLLRALEREKEEARVAKASLTALQTEMDTLRTDPARKTGDIKTLEASWQKKLDDATAAHTATNAALKATLDKTLVENAASTIAGAITGTPANASLMLPHILTRLEVVYEGDKPSVKIKDKDGRISAMNFDELQKELVTTPTFSSVVVASKASGAGGSGGGNADAVSGANGGVKKKFAEMTGPEKAALYVADPKDFQQQAADFEKERQANRFTR